jgi:hypothetical protein
MEFGGALSSSETFTLKTSLVVTSVFLSQELMGLPPSFVCLVEFHLKLSFMLDYQQYTMLYATVKTETSRPVSK